MAGLVVGLGAAVWGFAVVSAGPSAIGGGDGQAARLALDVPAQVPASPAPRTASAEATRSIWTGVYSDAQAERGHVVYLQSCAACHREDLTGDSAEEIPSLSSAEFLEGWSGRTVKTLLETLSRTMPGNAPGSLSAPQYLDLVAFILKENRLPSGRDALPGDPALLDRLRIEKAP